MGHIERWSTEKKANRRALIGEYIACCICKKTDGVSTWEGERMLKCRYCGAKWQKKQFYRRPKKEKTND